MLVSTADLLRDAQAGHYALGAFNIYNLELAKAVLRGAEQARAPVLLQLGAGQLKYGGYEPLVAMCLAAAGSAGVPVALHLDHGASLTDIERALAVGFSSVMLDGSKLDFEANAALTRDATALVHAQGNCIEAELGRLAGSEDAAVPILPSGALTEPEQAAEFVSRTGVDLLAVCIGNVHGFYAGAPQLDLARLEAIRACVPVPLVLHGTSGLPDEILRELIARGVVKFNLNTELRVAYFDTLQAGISKPNSSYDLAQLMNPVIEAVAKVVAQKLEVFGSVNRGGTDS